MFLMILKIILVVCICLPMAYLLLNFVVKFIDDLTVEQKELKKQMQIEKRKMENEKRVIYNDRGSRWSR